MCSVSGTWRAAGRLGEWRQRGVLRTPGMLSARIMGNDGHSPRGTIREADLDYRPRELRNHHVAIKFNSILFPSFISHISSAQ